MLQKNMLKKILGLMLVAVLVFTVSACKSGNTSSVPEEQQFTWWITKTDGQGEYYLEYEDNPAAQWLENQMWSSDVNGYTTDGSGRQLDLSYMAPITGTEADNYNTMLATGSYPEIIDLSYANDSPLDLHDEGILLEITEYVEAYMPDYLAFLEKHPELKPFVSHTDDDGEVHYYAIYGLQDSPTYPWQGYMYRRDWVVTYGTPTSHVWDLDSEYVRANGHPEVTPLEDAVASNNLTGWKVNDVTSFTSNWGDENTWEDNVIFPSGTDVPLYISDWEWMFDIFVEAIETEGYGDDPNAYATTLYYLGYMQTGDLVSSFGGGGPMWYIDQDNDAAFGATGDNFQTYLEAMNNWSEQGWLDSQFETRGTSQFFQINRTGVSQGKVGLMIGGIGYLGTTIRSTVEFEDAKDKAMLFGASLPINDVYGSDENKFINPDTYYGQGLLSPAVGITEKAEGKDMETLFTMMNWLYTDEGSLLHQFGLSEEQYDSMEFSPDLYAEHNLDRAYSVIENEDGTVTYVNEVPQSDPLGNAIKLNRLNTRLSRWGVEGEYSVDFGYNDVTTNAIHNWRMYENTGYILDHNTLMGEEDSSLYSKTNTYINDTMSVSVPEMIKEGLSIWDTYVSKIDKYGPGRVTNVYQEILDKLNGS